MARLANFIDGAYVDYLCRNAFTGMRVDFGKFAEEIRKAIAEATPEAVDLLRTFYYHCPPYQSNPPTEEERKRYAAYRRFVDALRALPRFEYREGRLEMRGIDQAGKPVFKQKRVDLLLGLDFALYSGRRQVSHTALVAGDSDLIAAVEVAKQEMVSTWLFHGPRNSYHADLWRAADERREIDRAFVQRCCKV